MQSSRGGRILAAIGCWLALGSAPAVAATHTWNGPAGGLWSNAANWTGGLPTSGEVGGAVVQFGAGTTSTMDIAGLTVDEIHFTGASNTINGNGTPLHVSGAVLVNNIVADATGNVLAATLPLALAGSFTAFVKSDTGTLTIASPISGTAGVRYIGTGANGTTLTGANAYTGTTTVASGTLHLNNNGINVAVVGGLLSVGVGGGAGANLVLDQSLEIADTTNIAVQNDGTFTTGASSEAVNTLTVNDGVVAMGTGTLTANGQLSMTGGTVSGTTGILALKANVVATSSAGQAPLVSAPVSLNGARLLTVADGPQPTDLTLSKVVSDGTAASSLGKAGTGTLVLSSAAPNTWTGGTNVLNGVLLLSGNASAVIPDSGVLTIGDGIGAPASAVVRLAQNSEISNFAGVVVAADGRLDLAAFLEDVANLTVNGGDVVVGAGTLTSVAALTLVDGTITLGGAGNLIAGGQTTMTGGAINGAGPGAFVPGANVVATSSAGGPATIGAPTRINATRTFTANAGTPPELRVTGGISDAGGGVGLVKAGTGTLVATGTGAYTGTTSVNGGELVVDGANNGAFVVAGGATLSGQGAVGATTVAGTLAPHAPALTTGALVFNATGRLAIDVTSITPGGDPFVAVAGSVAIDPAANLDLTLAPGLAVPAATDLKLIDNDGVDAVTGQFANASSGPLATIGSGLPASFRYNGGSGNDVDVTASNAPPVIGSIGATPNPSGTGQAVTLTLVATDANNDPLTVTWDFGDGGTGSGATTSHAFTTGTHTATATVSDGTAQAQATRVITTKDTVKPRLTKAKLSPASFKAAATGGSLTTAKTGGSKVAFTLSEAARVTFTVEQQQTGRLVGGKCVKRTGANAKRRSCKRSVPLAGSFATAGRLGVNTTRFTGRLRGKKLRPGAYRLVLTARDAAGNTSAVTRLSFSVVR